MESIESSNHFERSGAVLLNAPQIKSVTILRHGTLQSIKNMCYLSI